MEIENLDLQRQIDELSNWQNNLLNLVYPIGSIYMSIDNTNPEEFFGGAWIPWGTGRVPVGIDINDSDFNTIEKTGGEKTHTLTVYEMPSHSHSINTANGQGNMEWGYQFSYDGHNSGYNGIMQQVGGSQPHNNLQPYITCYMWKRVEPYYNFSCYDANTLLFSENYNTIEELKEGMANYLGNKKNISLSSHGIKTTSMENLFDGVNGVEKIDLSGFDTSDVTNMKDLFNGKYNLKELNLTNFNTTNVITMESMFGNVGMQNVDISNLDTSNVKNMRGMFANSQWLISLNLSNFNTSNVTDMSWMFNNCFDLETLDISNFDFSNVTDPEKMFNAIPSDCLITVKDQTAKDFVLNVRSDLTNVQIANT